MFVLMTRVLNPCRLLVGSRKEPYCHVLFILYINDMCNVSMLIKSIVCLFADDINLFYSGNKLSKVCETVSTELD